MPVPNRGQEAAALGYLAMVIKGLEHIVPMIGVTSELGKDVVKALNLLSKHLSQESGSPGVENSALQNMMMQQKQNGPMQALQRAGGVPGAGGPPGGGMGGPPGGGAPPPPPPSGM
jgi:hypothetical protein